MSSFSSTLSFVSMESILNDHSSDLKETDYDFEKELKLFEETKAGVKGLVDLGIKKIPRLFYHPLKNLDDLPPVNCDYSYHEPQVPVIDLSQLLKDGGRGIPMEITNRVREASETWGFFQIVNHGIPTSTMEEMLHGIRQFHEQPTDEKKKWYSTDATQRVRYYSNVLAKPSRFADWRDTLFFDYSNGTLDPETLPLVCRKGVSEYTKQLEGLIEKLSEVLSVALGLSPNYLSRIECMKTFHLGCHYYPVCPEPQLTQGSPKHSDPSFATILLQDHMGGLQTFYQDQWVHVQPIPGALMVIMGDLMQLLTSDLFKSMEHRVLAAVKDPRVSVACFLYPSSKRMSKPYGPLQDLVADDLTLNEEATYNELAAGDYLKLCMSRGQRGYSALPQFRVSGR